MINPDYNQGPTLREARYTERWKQSKHRKSKCSVTKIPATRKSSRFRALFPPMTEQQQLIRAYCRNF